MQRSKTLSLTTNKLLLIAGTGWLFDAMDVGLLSFILAALKQDWGLSATQLGTIGSVNSIGMAVGAFVFGLYADKKGRKAAFLFTLLMFSIASGLSAFAWGLYSLLVLRFFIGMGLGGELPVASTLVSESVAPNVRGRVVVLLESFWAVGWILAALIAYFLIPLPSVGWRGAMILCAMPAFYALYLRFNLPDSPTYSHSNEIIKKETVIQKIRLLFSKPFRQQSVMLWIVWFCVVFSYYGMFLWLPSVMMMKGFDMVKSFQYILIMTLAQLPGYFTVAWLIERVGRKWVLVSYLSGTLISAYLFGQADTANQLLIYGALLSFFNLGAWGAMYAYTPEQYSTNIRATGSGMAASVGRIGGILGPLMVGLLMAKDFSVSAVFALFSLSILVAIMAIVILGEETKQTELT
ncbi:MULTISPECIES: MFS transporter [unclassified Gilliamella]|uniref:MFS transporter n=1 Tax=unclassified Gilliamella TaxID=2685620 RepID=UPI00226AE51F|nr:MULTISPECIES: MFS transporter [unclassified Gilliamella]MCX8602458.1 MFS transporter [Gilliamella sp. B3722]MCX8608041.1 MFS transporter [Gilliamella sp. B3771]MCX8611617.1 MFS transporter [Gilliamella sp. B3891]MCX8614115.1 MFS transporter [Gilliamella sp. B3773]MCX8621383.1 MFS transporter [Gilliamella sp. B3892]